MKGKGNTIGTQAQRVLPRRKPSATKQPRGTLVSAASESTQRRVNWFNCQAVILRVGGIEKTVRCIRPLFDLIQKSDIDFRQIEVTDRGEVSGLALLDHDDSSTPLLGDIPQMRQDGLASNVNPNICSNWNAEELEGYLRECLPHFFRFLDTVTIHPHGLSKWYFCQKKRQHLCVCPETLPNGNTASLMRSGNAGVVWRERYIVIGTS